MATEKLKNQMNTFLTPSTETSPRMGLYDVSTPQSAREGTPKRLFSPERARYQEGDVVNDDKKEYNKALSVYSKMKQNGADDETIATYIGMPMLNRIKMNKQNVTQAATGGLMGGDPRLGRIEEVGYQAYAEGGEVNDEPMQIEELQPDVSMQMETAMMPGEDVETEATIDTSVLTSDEEQVLEQALEEYPRLMDIISKMSMKEFTGEGEVDGPGTGTSDSIPAMLSDGEFVFTAKSVKQIGVDRLRKMMRKAEDEYDRDMGVQDANQTAPNQPMMSKGGLLSVPL
tara:strand:+ start:238 stop:1095 length:858 start_codon:yes stop_codon:yes gene_type:complete